MNLPAPLRSSWRAAAGTLALALLAGAPAAAAGQNDITVEIEASIP